MPELKETIARLREELRIAEANGALADRYCNDLRGVLDAAEEVERLRADKERLDWLDNLPESTEFTPSEHGSTIREAIDAARSLQTHGRGSESTAEAKAK